MRNSAPAVQIDIRPDGLLRRLALWLPLGAVISIGVWAALMSSTGYAGADHLTGVVTVSAALLGSTCFAAWQLRRSLRSTGLIRSRGGAPPWQASHLQWNGQSWALTSSQDAGRRPCEVTVRIDAGRWVLLSLQGSPGPDPAEPGGWRCWLALSRGDQPANWHLLRCALYSTRPPPHRLNDR
jgi:hypothetical protein